jgi:molybdopterin-containing oxidoreductase family iron-sulfur binding subunit
MHDLTMHNSDTDNETSAAAAPDDMAAMRARLAGKKGKHLWKSLEELAGTDEFKRWVEDEFPNRADLLSIDRRNFLKLGGAALALAGLSGCRILPETKAVPYVRAPEEIVTGKTLSYATTLVSRGYGFGVLAESYEGRPIKIEGNPRHPASLGATDVFEQAEILNLYDPDRAQSVTNQVVVDGYLQQNAETSSWDTFLGALRREMIEVAKGRGAGMRLLTTNVTSPTLSAQITRLLARFPGAVWHQYEAVNRDNNFEGTRQAFGRPVNPVYRLDAARVVVSLDADFLKENPGNVRYARDFANGRRVRIERPEMNRLYVVESSSSITGAMADHRAPVRPSEVENVARALYAAVSGGSAEAPAGVRWFDAMVKDLTVNRGAAVVIPGENAAPAVHVLAHAINAALGAPGATVVYTAPVEARAENNVESLRSLVEALEAGKVSSLFILGGNPVFDAPADLRERLAVALSGDEAKKTPRRVRLAVRHGLYFDETSALCDWNLPAAHALEAWGDARAFDGTVSLIQPLIAPLYEGRSEVEVLAELLGEPRPGYEVVRDAWRSGTVAPEDAAAFDRWWQDSLYAGVIAGTTAAPLAGAAVTPGAAAALTAPAAAPTGEGVEVNFRPDPYLWDGRFANNSWLQELPRPLTTVTWDPVAMVSPNTAKQIGVMPTDSRSDAENAAQEAGKGVITVKIGNRQVNMPVWIFPGHPNGVVTLTLGFGRTRAGVVGTQGTSVGERYEGWFDAYRVRTADAMSFTGANLTVSPSGDRYYISTTQAHHMMNAPDIHMLDNRDVVRVATLQEFVAKKGEVGPEEGPGGEGGGHGGAVEEGPATEAGQPAGAEGHVGAVAGGHEGAHGPEGEKAGEFQTPAEGKTVPADFYRKDWEYKDQDPTTKTYANKEGLPSMYPEFSNKGYNAWAMGIDLTVCIGCNVCNVACQAENNIPTVGKDQVGRGREMHWIRVDHYFSGNAWEQGAFDDPATVDSHFMPVPCMHCEKAPCEPVCPVAATVHSHEGLNQMVYNRCVGTRYCSNNCPYKVRRFNFLKWTAGAGGPRTLNFFDLPVLKLAANPDVTVRGRGVMEKCSYCVQRINSKRIEAKKEQREIQDGEILTACQQACPTNAIIFGDLNNPNARVTQWKNQPHDYGLLAELNTRPRTTYLARIKNPNPAVAPASEHPSQTGKPA